MALANAVIFLINALSVAVGVCAVAVAVDAAIRVFGCCQAILAEGGTSRRTVLIQSVVPVVGVLVLSAVGFALLGIIVTGGGLF